MTLIYVDGFDGGDGNPANGRNGNGITNLSTFAIPAAQQSDTITMGAAVRSGAATNLMTVYNPDFDTIRVELTATNQLRVAFPGTVIQGPTAAGLFPFNTWAYLEWQVRQHDTLGFSHVRVNGTTVLSNTGLDTRRTASTVLDQIAIDMVGPNPIGLDDVYVCTGAGDSFFGDCVVETLYPNGNGTVNAWVGSDGNSTDNYALLNESPVVTSTYVGSSTPGAQDLYAFTDLTGTGAILAVSHAAHVQKTDAGARQVKFLTRRSSTNASAAVNLTTGFATVHYPLTVDPETGAAWTSANVNALQAGVEVV